MRAITISERRGAVGTEFLRYRLVRRLQSSIERDTASKAIKIRPSATRLAPYRSVIVRGA